MDDIKLLLDNVKSIDVEDINEDSKQKYIYHGSSNKISGSLNPNTSFHKQPYVYGTPSYEFALCHAGNQWNDLIINQTNYNGTIYLTEIKEGAFKEIYDREGYIYYLDPSTFEKLEGGTKLEVVSKSSVRIIKTEKINNVLRALEKSKVKLYKYPNLPEFISDRKSYLSKTSDIHYKNFNDDSVYNYVNDLYPDINLSHENYIKEDDSFEAFKHSLYIKESEWKSRYRLKFISTYHAIINKLKSYEKQLPNENIINYPDKDPEDWPSKIMIKFMDDFKGGPNDQKSGICTKSLMVCTYNEKAIPMFKRKSIIENLQKVITDCIPKDLQNSKEKMYFWIHKIGNKFVLTANSIIMNEAYIDDDSTSVQLEINSFDYQCLLLENETGIKKDYMKMKLSLQESDTLSERLKKEKLLSEETTNEIKIDYPALTPDEMINLGVYSEDNYYSNYKALMINEKYTSKDWFNCYQKMCCGVYDENSNEITQARNDKLLELCNELSKDRNNNQLKQYILELGWNPELPYTKGNRDLMAKNTRKKLNNFYNEFSHIDIQGIEDIDSIDEISEDNILYPVYIVILSSTSNFGKLIKKVTNSIWTHGAISFDTTMNRIYSYDREGFTYDNLEKYGKDSKLYVSAIFLKKKDYITMKSRLDYFISNKFRTHYGYGNLLRVLTGKVKDSDLNLICTEFVDKIFKFVDIDITNKSSNLVTPEDMYQSVRKKRKIYNIYKGRTGDYNKEKVDKRMSKLNSTAKVFKELFTNNLCSNIIDKYTITPIVETKEFPVQFDREGNLLIKNIKKINYNQEFAKSHKLLMEYEKSNNIEGMKYEISKLWFMYHLLDKIVHEKTLSKEELKAVNDSKARIYNDFSKYLKYIQKEEPDFNFNEYYEESPFSDSAYKFNASTIKYTKDFIKSLII